jgi:hypothetical protein
MTIRAGDCFMHQSSCSRMIFPRRTPAAGSATRGHSAGSELAGLTSFTAVLRMYGPYTAAVRAMVHAVRLACRIATAGAIMPPTSPATVSPGSTGRRPLRQWEKPTENKQLPELERGG